MRAFVALTPDDAAGEDLDAFLAPRRAAGDRGLRWSAPEQFHLTLAFLPELDEPDLDALGEGLRRAAARRVAFTAALAGAGAFPDAHAARVLYAAVDTGGADEELHRLARGVRNAASAAGTRVDGGRFHPHLTLARLARPTDVTRWLRVLETYRGPRFPVDRVALVRSRLGQGHRGRPAYDTLATYPLAVADEVGADPPATARP